jgi:molybdenum-dependent DNA-binding transcriptional regulator ModE
MHRLDSCDNPARLQFILAVSGPIMDRLGAMRIFLGVADRGSFSVAARVLRVSPAAASRAVAQLEAELGSALLSLVCQASRRGSPNIAAFVREAGHRLKGLGRD